MGAVPAAKAAAPAPATAAKRKAPDDEPKRKAPVASRAVREAAAGPEPPKDLQHKFLDAAKISDIKTVREMLEETPALINVQPAGRWSALHQAAHAGKPTAVKMLLSKGANIGLLTKDKE